MPRVVADNDNNDDDNNNIDVNDNDNNNDDDNSHLQSLFAWLGSFVQNDPSNMVYLYQHHASVVPTCIHLATIYMK